MSAWDVVISDNTEVSINNQSFGLQETYGFADITNRADWEIKDQLDEADRVLDDGVSRFYIYWILLFGSK